MSIRIALAGNPNCGKTTLFNALTGSNQFVGNWPGVTVEKKEGNLKKQDGVIITDLPGIYSLSPYTLEEVVARNYLVGERPDAVLNIIDGSNLERNLYLTTQIAELGIPMIAAINMIDVVRKKGDKINLPELSRILGCKVVEISALKSEGINEAAEAAIEAAKTGGKPPYSRFSAGVEEVLADIEKELRDIPESQRRWYAVKLFERDEKIKKQLKFPENTANRIETAISAVELELDDDAEAIITNERYNYITSIIGKCCKRKNVGKLSTSDKIDKIVTSRWLGLPIFAAVMFLVYYVSMVTVGAACTEWANEGLFGDGFHLLGIGTGSYQEAVEEYGDTDIIIEGAIAFAHEKGIDISAAEEALDNKITEKYGFSAAIGELTAIADNLSDSDKFTYALVDDETLAETTETGTTADLRNAISMLDKYKGEPAPSAYGVWIPGIPVIIGNILEKIKCADWLRDLILNGIVAGVGSVLGFVPQLLVLFLMLAFIESCGYMARVAFILDRIFRRFGLSGKSFIPILVGTGCGVPGIMASRTIENPSDRRMTIITTTFIPCGAKTPFIGMIAGAIFGNSPWVAISAYFLGMAAIIVSGTILKKTKIFAGEAAPFVMELPPYHMPTPGNVLRSMWERGWEFIKKAGTVILLCSVVVWFLTFFGFADGTFRMLGEDELDRSILAAIGRSIAWIFIPLGWGNWQSAVASVTGLIAKENIVGTLGILLGGGERNFYSELAVSFNGVAAYSFMAFNLLCAPCVAAMGAIRREMNSPKWTFFAIGYQCGFAYITSFIIYQLGSLFTGSVTPAGVVGACIAAAILIFGAWLVIKPERKAAKAAA